MIRILELPGAAVVGSIGTWGIWGLVAQNLSSTQSNILEGAIPLSIGALITFLAWSLKEAYRLRVEESREYSERLQQIYESKDSDLKRIYREVSERNGKILGALLANYEPYDPSEGGN